MVSASLGIGNKNIFTFFLGPAHRPMIIPMRGCAQVSETNLFLFMALCYLFVSVYLIRRVGRGNGARMGWGVVGFSNYQTKK